MIKPIGFYCREAVYWYKFYLIGCSLVAAFLAVSGNVWPLVSSRFDLFTFKTSDFTVIYRIFLHSANRAFNDFLRAFVSMIACLHICWLAGWLFCLLVCWCVVRLCVLLACLLVCLFARLLVCLCVR